MTKTDPTATTTSSPLRGVALVVFATLAFASADTVTKQVTQSHPVSVVMAIRYLVNIGLLTLILAPRLGSKLWRVNNQALVLVRGLALVFASLTIGLALRLMPVGETVAIAYVAPILVMLLAIPLLGERVTVAGWVGALVGFLGVLLVVRPGGGLAPLGVAIALANAGCSTVYHLLTRHLARTENTVAMLYQSSIVGSVCFGLWALGSLGGLSIGWADVAMMALLGVLATVGHFAFTAAYQYAPASLLAPVTYMHLFWAGGLGWLIFDHIPDRISLGGMALVCISGVIVALWAVPRSRAA